MNKGRIIAIYVWVVVLTLIAVGIVWVNRPSADSLTINDAGVTNVVDAQEDSMLKITPSVVDFGDIKKDGGVVSTTVVISNIGSKPLKMNRLSTSCGCTTAEMDMSDLAPNEEREMTITFDPMVHPDQYGELVRVVYLQTTDVTKEIEINVGGNVID